MKPGRALYFLSHVKSDLVRVLDSLGMKYYLHQVAFRQSDNCLFFEIETTSFHSDFFDYLRDFADECSVHLSSDGVSVYKATYSLA